MKFIKEHIYEEFKEDSDPIHDMGIGIYNIITFKTDTEMYKWLAKALPALL